MEQTILVNCTTTSSDFWSTAESIATVVSIMAVAAASIYWYFTATPLEKLEELEKFRTNQHYA